MILVYKDVEIEVRGILPVDFDPETDITVNIAKFYIDAALAEK